MFNNVSENFVAALANKLKLKVYPPKSYVIKLGGDGDAMYFLLRGTVEVVIAGGKVVAQMYKGSFFGEMALITGEKRTASIRCRSMCDIFILTKKQFRKVMRKFPQYQDEFDRVVQARKEADAQRKAEAERKEREEKERLKALPQFNPFQKEGDQPHRRKTIGWNLSRTVIRTKTKLLGGGEKPKAKDSPASDSAVQGNRGRESPTYGGAQTSRKTVTIAEGEPSFLPTEKKEKAEMTTEDEEEASETEGTEGDVSDLEELEATKTTAARLEKIVVTTDSEEEEEEGPGQGRGERQSGAKSGEEVVPASNQKKQQKEEIVVEEGEEEEEVSDLEISADSIRHRVTVGEEEEKEEEEEKDNQQPQPADEKVVSHSHPPATHKQSARAEEDNGTSGVIMRPSESSASTGNGFVQWPSQGPEEFTAAVESGLGEDGDNAMMF
eukprot:GCRY01006764.1.p1 GENE.GCRY01006764.1~~GCRY01006764.1.p1  ORF type:complete len:439 (-),score=150.02 GCRY01006764.1:91-1407(-)